MLVATTIDLALPSACSIHIAAIAQGFAEHGYRVTLVAPRLRGGAKPAVNLDIPGVEVIFTPFWTLPRTLNVLPMLGVVRRLAARTPFAAAYVRFSPLTPLLVRAFRHWRPGAPVISEHNGWVESEASLGHWWTPLCRLVGWLQAKDACWADSTRVVTQDIADCLHRWGVPAARYFVAENGTDLGRITPGDRDSALAAMGLDADKLYVGFLGTLTPWQGVEVLVRAMARLSADFPELRLLIGGDGDGMAGLRELVRRLGLEDRVVFKGWIRGEDARTFINALDVAVAPYHFPPDRPIGSPVKLRDYAAAGRPVVAADYPVIANVIDGEWCLLHRPGDDADLAERLRTLLPDAPRRAGMGRAARAAAERLFGWKGVIDAILARITPSV